MSNSNVTHEKPPQKTKDQKTSDENHKNKKRDPETKFKQKGEKEKKKQAFSPTENYPFYILSFSITFGFFRSGDLLCSRSINFTIKHDKALIASFIVVACFSIVSTIILRMILIRASINVFVLQVRSAATGNPGERITLRFVPFLKRSQSFNE